MTSQQDQRRSEMFRQTALDQVSTATGLDAYIKAVRPSTWLVAVAAVIAMIASAALSLLILALFGQRTVPEENILSALRIPALCIFALALFVLRKWKVHPLWVMAGAGAISVVLYYTGITALP